MSQHDETAAPILNPEFMREQPVLAAHMLERLDVREVMPLLTGCDAQTLIPVLQQLPPGRMGQILEHCDPALTASVLDRLSIPRAAALLRTMPEALRKELLARIHGEQHDYLQQLLDSPPNSAASMMDPRVLHLHPTMKVKDALDLLRVQQFHRRPTQTRRILLLLDDDRHLQGIVAIQDLAFAAQDELLRDYVQSMPATVLASANREEILEILEKHHVSSLPVVDEKNRLLGIVRQEELNAISREDAVGDIQAMFGVSREEKALSPPMFSVRQRLPWLQINLFTAFAAAAVVGLFEETIAAYTALAVLLPVVAGQSGNTGAQALAVVMRGLALREISLAHTPGVLRKELLVGITNGIGVAITTCIAVYLWSGSVGLMFIIGMAMVSSMVLAGIAGATVPLMLTRLGQDPAQSASIILTTVTDIVGFFSFLGIATLLMWAI